MAGPANVNAKNARTRSHRAGMNAGYNAVTSKEKRPEGLSALPASVGRSAALLELEPQSELDPSGIAVDGPDLHKVRIREARHRVAPTHVVQDVARLHPELGPITTDREAAEDAQVKVVV